MLFESCFRYSQRIGKTAPLEIKIYCTQFQLIELMKTEDFEHSLLDPSSTKSSPQ